MIDTTMNIKLKLGLVLLILLGLARAGMAETVSCDADPRAVEVGEVITVDGTVLQQLGTDLLLDVRNVNGNISYEMTRTGSWGSNRYYTYNLSTDAMSGVYWLTCTTPAGNSSSGGSVRVGTTFNCASDYAMQIEVIAQGSGPIYRFDLTNMSEYIIDANCSNCEVVTNATINNQNQQGQVMIIDATANAGDLFAVRIHDFYNTNTWAYSAAPGDENHTINLTDMTYNRNMWLMDMLHELTNTDYYCTGLTSWELMVRCRDYAPYELDLCEINNTLVLVAPREDDAALRSEINSGTHVRELMPGFGAKRDEFYLLTSPFTQIIHDYYVIDLTEQYSYPRLAIKKHVDNGLETIMSKDFDTDGWVFNIQLAPNHGYQVFVQNDSREYSMGYVIAERNRTRAGGDNVFLTIGQPLVSDYHEMCPSLSLNVSQNCITDQAQCSYNSSEDILSGHFVVYDTSTSPYTELYSSVSEADVASFSWTINETYIDGSVYAMCIVNHSNCNIVINARQLYCGDATYDSAFNVTQLPTTVIGQPSGTMTKFAGWVIITIVAFTLTTAVSVPMGLSVMTGMLAMFQWFEWIPTDDVSYILTTMMGVLALFSWVFSKRKGVAG